MSDRDAFRAEQPSDVAHGEYPAKWEDLSPEYRAAWDEWAILVHTKAPRDEQRAAWRRVNEILDAESARGE